MFPFFLIPKADIVQRHLVIHVVNSFTVKNKCPLYYEQALEVVNFKCTLFSTSHAPFDLINRQ